MMRQQQILVELISVTLALGGQRNAKRVPGRAALTRRRGKLAAQLRRKGRRP